VLTVHSHCLSIEQAGSLAVFLYVGGVFPLWACLCFLGSVCVSRVYWGVHWVGDTIVGALLGAFCAALVLAMEASLLLSPLI
jgi:membrane-associated phospholipid phosphatase